MPCEHRTQPNSNISRLQLSLCLTSDYYTKHTPSQFKKSPTLTLIEILLFNATHTNCDQPRTGDHVTTRPMMAGGPAQTGKSECPIRAWPAAVSGVSDQPDPSDIGGHFFLLSRRLQPKQRTLFRPHPPTLGEWRPQFNTKHSNPVRTLDTSS